MTQKGLVGHNWAWKCVSSAGDNVLHVLKSDTALRHSSIKRHTGDGGLPPEPETWGQNMAYPPPPSTQAC